VERAFLEIKPDIVVHAAGFLGGINFSRLYPGDVFLKNLQIACNVLEMTRKHRVKKLVNIGSACVYSDQLKGPFKEEDMMALPMHPSVQYYGFSKQALYLGGRAFSEQFRQNSIHLVLTNLYGPGDKFDPELSHVVSSMIPKFYDAMKKGNPEVICWGSGNTVREFLYVEDCAEAILRATESYNNIEPLNIGVGEGITMRNLAELIKKVTKYDGKIVWDTSKPDGATYKVVDSSKAHAQLNWVPPTSFENGIRKTVSWFSEYYEKWLVGKNQ
jgi:GDP-L-fucose synthase